MQYIEEFRKTVNGFTPAQVEAMEFLCENIEDFIEWSNVFSCEGYGSSQEIFEELIDATKNILH